MEQWAEIRRRVLVEGVTKRQILRETGMHWQTLEKILRHGEPPGYRQAQARPKPKIGPWLERLAEILRADGEGPRKQRHTAKRIFERLREEGYTGGYTSVKSAVAEARERGREVFVPLTHRPGEAQVDFGQALACVGGVLRKVHLFVMALPFSDAMFVMAFERECTESFWEGHVRGFAFFGGVPRRIIYDNSRIAVEKILGVHARQLTRGFLRLKSHYLFDHHFCRVRRANEKGLVEGALKYARLNFLVPVPQVRSIEELNETLAERCRADARRRLRGQAASKQELLQEDRASFLALPATPFEACRLTSTTANSLSLVRFDGNDYSVPTAYAHHPVVVKGFLDYVEVSRLQEVVARHRRIWGKERVSLDPLHYLALLERKPGAFDHARPLEGWQLPECFVTLRRRMEAELDGQGTREYIGVLRLLEKHSLAGVTRAVEKSLSIRAHRCDAITQFLLPPEEARATVFRLDGREHLRRVRVAAPDLSGYRSLLTEGAA